jgi:hypothetical protein
MSTMINRFKILLVAVSLSVLSVYAQDNAVPAQPAVDAEPAVTAPAETLAEGSVVRAIFTSSIQDREPVDQLTEATTDAGQIYFFTELRDLQGQTVQHQWKYEDQVVTNMNFNVGAARWRVWSSKSVQPERIGVWTVSVINGNGNVIAMKTIELKPASVEDATSGAAAPDSVQPTDTTGISSSP